MRQNYFEHTEEGTMESFMLVIGKKKPLWACWRPPSSSTTQIDRTRNLQKFWRWKRLMIHNIELLLDMGIYKTLSRARRNPCVEVLSYIFDNSKKDLIRWHDVCIARLLDRKMGYNQMCGGAVSRMMSLSRVGNRIERRKEWRVSEKEVEALVWERGCKWPIRWWISTERFRRKSSPGRQIVIILLQKMYSTWTVCVKVRFKKWIVVFRFKWVGKVWACEHWHTSLTVWYL